MPINTNKFGHLIMMFSFIISIHKFADWCAAISKEIHMSADEKHGFFWSVDAHRMHKKKQLYHWYKIITLEYSWALVRKWEAEIVSLRLNCKCLKCSTVLIELKCWILCMCVKLEKTPTIMKKMIKIQRLRRFLHIYRTFKLNWQLFSSAQNGLLLLYLPFFTLSARVCMDVN